MIIKQADIFATAVGPDQYPPGGRPEIALAGRSNVGKSSLINSFIRRKNLARTSSQPGKTQTLNFYEINKEWFFVDLPGYGYAKTAKTERARWGKFIEEYLGGRKELVGVIQLVDFRHPPMDSDQTMVEWLQHYGFPLFVAGTKADKVPKSQWSRQVKQIRQGLALGQEVPVIPYSATTGQGRDELAQWLLLRIEGGHSTVGLAPVIGAMAEQVMLPVKAEEEPAAKAGAKPATKAGARPAAKVGAKPATKAGAKPATKAGAKPPAKAGSKAPARAGGAPPAKGRKALGSAAEPTKKRPSAKDRRQD